MKALATSAIVLRRVNYGEADRIITFLSSEFGKIRLIVKGARRQKSKLAGGIELFSVSELHYINGRGDIGTLTSSRLQRYYSSIVKDLDRTDLAYHMLKRIDRIVEDETGSEYFEILDQSLAALDCTNNGLDLVRSSFEMRVLRMSGSLPDFRLDKNGDKVDENKAFRFDAQSLLFEPHDKGNYGKNHIKLLNLLAYNSPNEIIKITKVNHYCSELQDVIRSLITSQYNF